MGREGYNIEKRFLPRNADQNHVGEDFKIYISGLQSVEPRNTYLYLLNFSVGYSQKSSLDDFDALLWFNGNSIEQDVRF